MRRKQYHRLTEEQKDKIVLLNSQGICQRFIAESFDIVPATVTRVCKVRRERDDGV